MDIGVRQETLITMPGQPVLVQLPLIPAYALTVHKTQALSIKHIVRGCYRRRRVANRHVLAEGYMDKTLVSIPFPNTALAMYLLIGFP